MACESTGKNERRVSQFNRIRLLCSIADRIIMLGMRAGYAQLSDYVDMNCGAVPDGDFEQVIDLNAPHQFLSMYMQIAENRFAFACNAVLRMNPSNKDTLVAFCAATGREMGVEPVTTVEQAFSLVETFVLDGMPCDETKRVVRSTEQELVWEKVMDTHQAAWEKAGGDVAVYYELQQGFVNGLLEKSGIRYEVQEAKTFTLRRA